MEAGKGDMSDSLVEFILEESREHLEVIGWVLDLIHEYERIREDEGGDHIEAAGGALVYASRRAKEKETQEVAPDEQ